MSGEEEQISEEHLEPDTERYLELIAQINEDPFDSQVFAAVVSLAREEEDKPISSHGPYFEIPLAEMIEMAQRIKEAKSMDTRYELLTQRASNGELWYDLILGLANREAAKFLLDHLGLRFRQNALDVGCGSGTLTNALAERSKSVVGIDKSELTIVTANQSNPPPNVSYKMGDATQIPFGNHSFDLVTSLSMINYLSEKEVRLYVSEIIRVLKAAGEYYEVYATGQKGAPILSPESHFVTNAKGVLACLMDRMITHELYANEGKRSSIEILKEEFREHEFVDVTFSDLKRGFHVVKIKRKMSLEDITQLGT